MVEFKIVQDAISQSINLSLFFLSLSFVVILLVCVLAHEIKFEC